MQRFLFVLFALLVLCGSAKAQDTSRSAYEVYQVRRQEAYRDFRRQRQQAYYDFRARRNAEYASYMERRWTAYRTMAGLEEPTQPQPVPVPIDELARNVPPVDYEIEGVTVVPSIPEPTPNPDFLPISRPMPNFTTNPNRSDSVDRRKFAFSFYDTPCRLSFTDGMRFRLNGLSEQQVVRAWNQLSDGRCEALVAELQQLRSDLRLGDWGFLKLVVTACEAFCGSSGMDEAVVLEFYLLTQSDLKVRVAYSDFNLLLLFCPEEMVYRLTFFEIENERFYVTDKNRVKGGYRIFDRAYPGEHSLSMRMTALPKLSECLLPPHAIASQRYPEVMATVSVNRNLLDFMTDYPSCRWDMYAGAGMSESLKTQLYPMLKQAMIGRNEKEAVDLLLDFIQTGLAYKTDFEQFGRERSLFVDESCFYPYCDCEDRAILLAVLVHDLLGLEIVLLNYPEHVSTAICFHEPIEGDHFNHRGKRYVCCDPSYIGACVGCSMPDYKHVSPIIIPIW